MKRGENESEVKKGEGAGDKYFCLRLIWLKIRLITSLICKLGRMFFLTAVPDLSLFFFFPPPSSLCLSHPRSPFLQISTHVSPQMQGVCSPPSRRTHVCARSLTSPQSAGGVMRRGSGGSSPNKSTNRSPYLLSGPANRMPIFIVDINKKLGGVGVGGDRGVRRGREQAIKQQEERDEGKRKAKIKERDNGRRIREGRNEEEGFAGLK